MHCTSGTTGTPKGVWSGLLDEAPRPPLWSPRSATCGASAADDVNLVLSPLYHSAPLRFAMGTVLAGGRVVIPGPFDPAAVTAAIERERPTTMFCVPTHLQRLFAHWDALLDAGRAPGPLLLPPGRPRRRAVPHRREAPADRALPTGHRPGSSTARPRASSPPAGARSGCERPGTVGRARPGRLLTADPDGTLWCVVPDHAPVHLLRRPGQDRGRVAGDRAGPGVHRRRPRPDRRRRLRLPRRPARGPDHQRRRQRLPGRGRAGARRVPGRRRHRGLRRARRGPGASGSARRSSARSTRPRWRRTPATTWRRRSGRRPTSSAPTCRAR